jgi:hypothetical protein
MSRLPMLPAGEPEFEIRCCSHDAVMMSSNFLLPGRGDVVDKFDNKKEAATQDQVSAILDYLVSSTAIIIGHSPIISLLCCPT